MIAAEINKNTTTTPTAINILAFLEVGNFLEQKFLLNVITKLAFSITLVQMNYHPK